MAAASKYLHFSIRGLIIVWIAEGLLKPIGAKSLEDVAHEYITDLIDRNLISVRRRGILGRLKSYDMHDLVRDLCLREAQKENFLCVIDEHSQEIPPKMQFKRRLYFRQSNAQVIDLLRPVSLTRSMTGEFGWTISLASSIRLLKVFDVMVDAFPPQEAEIMQLVNLRLIGIGSRWDSNSMWRFTSSISQFWSLQTLYFYGALSHPIFLPSEIWEMPHLRHLRFNKVVLPDPPCSDNDEHDSHILENLHSLSTVVNFRCTMEIPKRVPNLKKLKVLYDHLSPGVDWPFFCLHNLVHLHKLESLHFRSIGPISLKYLSFPLSLKALRLCGCRLPLEDMRNVGSVPNLEALVLSFCEFEGLEWCPVEGGFVRLKLLDIFKSDLLHWRADKTHFPCLEILVLEVLDLAEIPLDLGKIPTLGRIEVLYCSDSTNTWAEQIREEQTSFGDEDLQVIIKQRG